MPKKKQPPRKLEPKTATGKPRCQRWIAKKGRGPERQCPNVARQGFPTCHMHGSGSEKREREGARQNPKTASIVTGEHATPEARQMYLEKHPQLHALYQHFLYSPELLNLRPELAAARAMAMHFSAIANLDQPEGTFAMSDPPVLKAISAILDVARIAKEVLVVEQKLGPVPRMELDRVQSAVVATFQRYVPAEKYLEALGYLRGLLAGEAREPARVLGT